jgi:glutamate formiminotransferase
MVALVVPNVSEGRDLERLRISIQALEDAGTPVLDVHSDAHHNRSVLTLCGEAASIPEAMVALARSLDYIDLRQHRGVHPRLGALDVCPVVPTGDRVHDTHTAVGLARAVGEAIAASCRLPVFFYGEAARRPETRTLASIRRGGLDALRDRVAQELPPDAGPSQVSARRGIVCVGARAPMIAFNVWLQTDGATARRIAARIRASNGGPPGLLALGWALPGTPYAQVSMNLADPDRTGIDQAFEMVARQAAAETASITGTEVVGMVLDRHLPHPRSEATRLLLAPVRSLEEALSRL